MKEIKIDTEFIKLGQALKLSGIANMGSEAKALILDGKVKVNNEIALERGKKLRNNDAVSVEGFDSFIVITN